MAERHTPPTIKWLANELAALKGELQQVEDRLLHLTERRAQLSASIRALSKTSELFGVEGLEQLVPVVHAYTRYGGRGNLLEFLERVVRAASPEFIDTVSLTHLAIEAFGLPVNTEVEFNRFRDNSLRRALRRLQHRGSIECSHTPDAGKAAKVSHWRWRNQLPGLAELRIAAMAPPEI